MPDFFQQTTVAFGIWGGIVLCGSVFHIVKRARSQLLVYMIVVVTFSGALASGNTDTKGQSAAFSFLATLPAGVLEILPAILVQLECDETELGTAFGKRTHNPSEQGGLGIIR